MTKIKPNHLIVLECIEELKEINGMAEVYVREVEDKYFRFSKSILDSLEEKGTKVFKNLYEKAEDKRFLADFLFIHSAYHAHGIFNTDRDLGIIKKYRKSSKELLAGSFNDYFNQVSYSEKIDLMRFLNFSIRSYIKQELNNEYKPVLDNVTSYESFLYDVLMNIAKNPKLNIEKKLYLYHTFFDTAQAFEQGTEFKRYPLLKHDYLNSDPKKNFGFTIDDLEIEQFGNKPLFPIKFIYPFSLYNPIPKLMLLTPINNDFSKNGSYSYSINEHLDEFVKETPRYSKEIGFQNFESAIKELNDKGALKEIDEEGRTIIDILKEKGYPKDYLNAVREKYEVKESPRAVKKLTPKILKGYENAIPGDFTYKPNLLIRFIDKLTNLFSSSEKQDNNPLKKNNTPVKQNNNLVKENNATVKENNATVKENNATVKENNNLVKEFYSQIIEGSHQEASNSLDKLEKELKNSPGEFLKILKATSGEIEKLTGKTIDRSKLLNPNLYIFGDDHIAQNFDVNKSALYIEEILCLKPTEDTVRAFNQTNLATDINKKIEDLELKLNISRSDKDPYNRCKQLTTWISTNYSVDGYAHLDTDLLPEKQDMVGVETPEGKQGKPPKNTTEIVFCVPASAVMTPLLTRSEKR
jgi:hypothetical protein